MRAGTWSTRDSSTHTGRRCLNRYAYVQNDPINFVDPSGLASKFYVCDLLSVSWTTWATMEWGGCQEDDHGGGGGSDDDIRGGRGGGGGPASQSLDHVVPLDKTKARSLLDKMLKNDRCKEFLNAVLKEVGSPYDIEGVWSLVLNIH